MDIRTEVREVEKYVKSKTSDKDKQIEIISKAQSLELEDERSLAVLIIVKNRIIHS